MHANEHEALGFGKDSALAVKNGDDVEDVFVVRTDVINTVNWFDLMSLVEEEP